MSTDVDFGARRSVRARASGDHCSRAGASAIAEAIESYWNARGFAVHLIIKHSDWRARFSETPRFDVRSDMRNGWPVKK